MGFSSWLDSSLIVSFDVKTGVDGGVDTGLTSIVVGSLVATGVAVMDTELTVFFARIIVADPGFVGAIFLDATGVEGLVADSCTVLTALVAGEDLDASPLVTTAETFELVTFLVITGVPEVGSDSELMFFLLSIGVAVSGLVTLSCIIGRIVLVAFLASIGVPVAVSCTILTALVAGGNSTSPLAITFWLVTFLVRIGVPTDGSDSEFVFFLDRIGVALSNLAMLSEVAFGEGGVFPAMGWKAKAFLVGAGEVDAATVV